MTAIDETRLNGSKASHLDPYAPWVAIAAVGLGLTGIACEVARRWMPRDRFNARFVADHHEFTPPHGDKLMPHTRTF